MLRNNIFFITDSENIGIVAGSVCSKSADGKKLACRMFNSKLASTDFDSFEYVEHTNVSINIVINSDQWTKIKKTRESIDD